MSGDGMAAGVPPGVLPGVLPAGELAAGDLPAGTGPAPGGARRRVWWAAAVLVVLLVAGVLAASIAEGASELRQTDAMVQSARHRLDLDRQRAARQSTRLSAALGARQAVATDLAHVNASLRSTGKALSGAAAAVAAGTLDLAALNTCLGGVEQALNASSVGDDAHAVSALAAVSASCRSAKPGKG